MKKIIVLAICAVFVAAVFSACSCAGGGADNKNTETTASVEAETGATQASETTADGGTIEKDSDGNVVKKDKNGKIVSVEDKNGDTVNVEQYIANHGDTSKSNKSSVSDSKSSSKTKSSSKSKTSSNSKTKSSTKSNNSSKKSTSSKSSDEQSTNNTEGSLPVVIVDEQDSTIEFSEDF